MNRTFSIIKPDATKRNITGAINKIIEENKMQFPNYINVAHESADKELGGDYNDEENNEISSEK